MGATMWLMSIGLLVMSVGRKPPVNCCSCAQDEEVASKPRSSAPAHLALRMVGLPFPNFPRPPKSPKAAAVFEVFLLGECGRIAFPGWESRANWPEFEQRKYVQARSSNAFNIRFRATCR